MFFFGSAGLWGWLFFVLPLAGGEDPPQEPPEPKKDLAASIADQCELVKEIMNTTYDVRLQFDAVSIQWIDHFIEKERTKITARETDVMTAYLGLFLGEAIRQRCGGTWQTADGEPSLALAEGKVLFPVRRVAQQFKDGPPQSVFLFYLETSKAFGKSDRAKADKDGPAAASGEPAANKESQKQK